MRFSFEGKAALVTGAAHGFGREIAHSFARLGARVYAADVNEAGLVETAATADPAWGLQVVRLDVTDRDGVRSLVERVVAEAGSVDVVVNNAGGVLGQVGRPIEQVPYEDWRAIFGVNLDGAFNTSQAAAPHMKRQGSGRIVNVSSGAGLRVSLTGIQAYAAAKAGLIGLTRQLAHELGPWNITVNCIAPGFVLSNPTTQRQWESYGPEGQRRLVESLALKRLGTPQDIAAGVLFFASEHAGWVTGQTLSVDGGRL